MSLPTSRALRPAATAAALPPLEPPGVRSRSQGLLVRPWMGLADCQSASMGGTFVLPRRTAPAALARATAGASCFETKSRHSGTPHVVGKPTTLNDSLIVMGRPSRASRSPRAIASSADRARRRARSKSRTTTALRRPS